MPSGGDGRRRGPLGYALDELEICNRLATDRYIVDNVRGARVTRWCPMNGGERIVDRVAG
ncbi:MAG: hypothetical protein ACRDIL_12770 [Candidatus Limnocylindrales bacterium]